MEQEESVGAVQLVQPVDAASCGVDDRLVGRRGRRVGIAEIGQQREMDVRVPVRKEADLELVEQRQQARLRVDDRRHDDHRAIAGRNAVAHVELGKLPRTYLRRDDQVQQADGELADRQQRHDQDEPELDPRGATSVRRTTAGSRPRPRS